MCAEVDGLQKPDTVTMRKNSPSASWCVSFFGSTCCAHNKASWSKPGEMTAGLDAKEVYKPEVRSLEVLPRRNLSFVFEASTRGGNFCSFLWGEFSFNPLR